MIEAAIRSGQKVPLGLQALTTIALSTLDPISLEDPALDVDMPVVITTDAIASHMILKPQSVSLIRTWTSAILESVNLDIGSSNPEARRRR